jgi:hypothetical protein
MTPIPARLVVCSPNIFGIDVCKKTSDRIFQTNLIEINSCAPGGRQGVVSESPTSRQEIGAAPEQRLCESYPQGRRTNRCAGHARGELAHVERGVAAYEERSAKAR